MSKFGSKEEILSSIQALFENIQSGSLTADEMESLVELTRELHERALILRYKSYEEKIFGIAPTNVEVQMEETFEEMEAAAEVEEISEEPHILSFEEVEEEILEHEKQEVTNDEPVFDFDMFEKAEEEDIFSPEMVIEPTPELEPTIFNEPIVEEVHAEPEISEPITEETFEVESTPIFSEPETTVESEVNTDIFNRYSSNSDDSLSSRLMSSKLQTLVGSFGLNDKLQCIRELFKGSSEAFNQAIEQLDNQADFSAAKRVLAQYAQQYSWDLESNLTAEFIQKVERRYL
jgi:flagellar biosynthesis GTPase FlhF